MHVLREELPKIEVTISSKVARAKIRPARPAKRFHALPVGHLASAPSAFDLAVGLSSGLSRHSTAGLDWPDATDQLAPVASNICARRYRRNHTALLRNAAVAEPPQICSLGPRDGVRAFERPPRVIALRRSNRLATTEV